MKKCYQCNNKDLKFYETNLPYLDGGLPHISIPCVVNQCNNCGSEYRSYVGLLGIYRRLWIRFLFQINPLKPCEVRFLRKGADLEEGEIPIELLSKEWKLRVFLGWRILQKEVGYWIDGW